MPDSECRTPTLMVSAACAFVAMPEVAKPVAMASDSAAVLCRKPLLRMSIPLMHCARRMRAKLFRGGHPAESFETKETSRLFIGAMRETRASRRSA